MRKCTVWAAAALAACLSLTACGNSPSAQISAATTQSVEGLVLHAGVNALVGIAYNVNPVLGGAVELGVYAYKEATKKVHLLAAEHAVTVLEVKQVINGRAKYSIFKVTTSRKLTVALNGHFVEYITAHRILIDVAPNTASTIVVTVKNQAGVIYRKGQFVFGFTYGRQLFNLDTGVGGHLAGKDAELYRHLRVISGINGTEVSRWSQKQPPTLANCASLPASAWSTELSGIFTVFNVGTTWCVRTTRHRYGVIVESNAFENVFQYVLWKKPSDLAR